MDTSPASPPSEAADLVPIRMETVLSRFPVHDLSKGKAARSHDKIEIRDRFLYGQSVSLWKVTYNSEYGQPGQDGYKIDTLIVNRRIEEAIEDYGRPIPRLLKLGSLRDICRELGAERGPGNPPGQDRPARQRQRLRNRAADLRGQRPGQDGADGRSRLHALQRHLHGRAAAGRAEGRCGLSGAERDLRRGHQPRPHPPSRL